MAVIMPDPSRSLPKSLPKRSGGSLIIIPDSPKPSPKPSPVPPAGGIIVPG